MKYKLFRWLPVFLLFILPAVSSQLKAQKTSLLFTPDHKDEWYTFLQKSGRNADPLNVFRFDGQTLQITGEDIGYIITTKTFGEFHLSLEFKWGEKKYPPRENQIRDAGVLYFAQTFTGDRIWPLAFECQIQEGDCGDFWLIGGAQMVNKDTLTPAGGGFRVIKSKDAEKPHGEWNTIEIMVKDGKITHKVNGQVVNTGSKPSLTRGRILLQSEAAEVFFRNIKLVEY